MIAGWLHSLNAGGSINVSNSRQIDAWQHGAGLKHEWRLVWQREKRVRPIIEYSRRKRTKFFPLLHNRINAISYVRNARIRKNRASSQCPWPKLHTFLKPT